MVLLITDLVMRPASLITVHAPKDFNTVHPSEGAFGKILLNAHWSVRTKDID